MKRNTHYSIGNSGGFTLVEIMIVVAIIALLAAIAIPNLLRARLQANESASIGTLRTVGTAEETLRAATTPPSFGDFDALYDTPVAAGQPPFLNIDGTTATTIDDRQGYNFALAGFDANTYCVTAVPVTQDTTGIRHFVTDGSGVIYGTAGGADPDCTGAAPFEWDGNGGPLQ